MGIVTSIASNIPCLSGYDRDQGECPHLQEQEAAGRPHTPSFESSGYIPDNPSNSSAYTSPYITPNPSLNNVVPSPSLTQNENGSRHTELVNYQDAHQPTPNPPVFYPDDHPFPIIYVTCTARGTRHGRIPSAYFYNDDPRNPIIYHTMLFRLRVTNVPEAKEIRGYIAGVRTTNSCYIEFLLAGRAEDTTLSAYLIVPLDRATIPEAQIQVKLSPQPQTPHPIHDLTHNRATVEIAELHSTEQSTQVTSVCNIPFPPIEAPSPTYHPSVSRHLNLQ